MAKPKQEQTTTEAPAGKEKKDKKPAISRADFLKHATPLEVKIGDLPMGADVKEFSTGSFGWNINGKATIKVNGVAVPVQVGLNLTVINSKQE